MITFITPTPNDGGVLVGGWTGALYHLRKENGKWRGKWQTGKRIDIRNTKNEVANSYVALPSPNSPEVLVGGDCGAFYQLSPNKIPSIDQIISKYDN